MLKRSSHSRVLDLSGRLMDQDFSARYPTLWHHLTQLEWDDGGARKPSTIGIYPERGIIRVLFRDVDSGVMAWVATTRLSDLWELLESVLCDSGTDWRLDRRSAVDRAVRVKEPPLAPNGVDKRKRKH